MLEQWWKNSNGSHNYVKDPTSCGIGNRAKLARANNDTFRANNGSFPDRPYSPYGTYSTGK